MQHTLHELEARYGRDMLVEMGVYDEKNRILKKISQLKPLIQEYEDAQLCRCTPAEVATYMQM
jgi:hypothetical protein